MQVACQVFSKKQKAKVVDLGLLLFVVVVLDLLSRSFERFTRLSDQRVNAIQSVVVF